MKSKFFLSLVTAAISVFLGGCASTQPVSGILYSDVSGPVAISSAPRGSLHGEACATSYVGMVALGDASITKAAKAGGIGTISYVEQHSTNIFLGIVNTYCTQVWGFAPRTAAATPDKAPASVTPSNH